MSQKNNSEISWEGPLRKYNFQIDGFQKSHQMVKQTTN